MFSEKDYWNNRYAAGHNSGDGSYGLKLARKFAALTIIPKEEIQTIYDVGCGDYNFGLQIEKLFPDARYHGVDISDEIVRRNKKEYGDKFSVSTGTYQTADLLICADVLFHIISDEDYERTLAALKAAWKKYLVITACDKETPSEAHMKIRKFDPTYFSETFGKFLVEEEGTYLYIFRK